MIKMSEYAKRRAALMRKIGANSVMVLPAAKEVIRNGDAHFPYRQDSDFYYLTGFTEPAAVMVLVPKRRDGEYVLFNRPRDPEHEQWDGPRAGQAGAKRDYMADVSFSMSEFVSQLPVLLAGRESVYYPLGHDEAFDRLMMCAVREVRSQARSGLQPITKLMDASSLIHEMRLIKSPAEVALLQKAVDITADAHVLAMQICEPGMNESELEAVLSFQFKKQGAQHTAYSSIVGAGRNTCILHYVKNNQLIRDGDLVLIDAGAEYGNYAADITRTFPANGRFSAEQRAIYDLVLAAQTAAIKTIQPGKSWHAAQQAIEKVITQGLIDLGILKGKFADLLEQRAFYPFYMHRSGHWLGLDVHDAGLYKINNKWRSLEAGMVLTVEPGIYIGSHIAGVPKRWHHIGVRIEDDVLVTHRGCDVLSRRIPKEADDIEALMAD